MRKLSSTDQATRSIKADGEKVVCIHTVKPDRESPTRYELTWTFDFSNVSQEELLQLAGRTVLITQQAAWRALPTDKERLDADKVDNVTYSVRDMLDAGRRQADPKAKVVNAAAKMSDAERAELIKQLEAMQKADDES